MNEAQKEQARKKAVRRINENGGKVNEHGKTIAMPKFPGIGVWGAIDCLTHYFKFSILVDK